MARFVRAGEYWTIAFEGRTTLLRDVRGLVYLRHLLRSAGREVHAIELAQLGRCGQLPSRSAFADAGAVLDEQAKRAYRERLLEIESELEEARTFSDPVRERRAEEERSGLVRELSRAVGIGGRDRRVGAVSERARAAVTQAIRHALKKIDEHDAALGAHLDRTIRTGTFCAYLPDPRARVDWDTGANGD